MLHLVRILVLVSSLLVAALRAQGHGGDAHTGQTPRADQAQNQGQTQHADQTTHDEHGHVDRPTMETPEREFFTSQYAHLVPHKIDELSPTVSPDPDRNHLVAFYNVNKFQLGAVVFIFVLFSLVLASFKNERTPWILRVFRGWVLWIRDEMVVPVLGERHARKLGPYFVYLFFFIAFLNLVSLIPGSVTTMATIFVTGALALQSLVLIVWMAVREQGVGGFVKHLLAPPGVPWYVLPIMAPVEVLSLFVKPMALMIRLFANLLAGHMVLYSFIGIIFVFAKMMNLGAISYLTALPALGLAIFVNILEGFIVLLQAYVFTYLTLIFVGQMAHHEHAAH
ncbi:MAG: F0F1 ATP synthase subunit A [Planctomycetota bacterium]